ncbi:alpha/beta fold hydrolase [bacterium]|nr:alpha/beta fold hydrolase [bacterium]
MMEPVFFTELFNHPTREGERIPIHVTAWGDSSGPLVFCLHGLTRNGRDFDRPARMLADMGYYALCPDMPGRGESPNLPHGEDYQLPLYVGLMLPWLAKLGNPSFGILGTSMGGMIGMALGPVVKEKLQWLILNDVGSQVDYGGLKRINTYVGEGHFHQTREQAERVVRLNLATWALPDEQATEHFLRHSITGLPAPLSDGSRYSLAYDLAIADCFKQAFSGMEAGTPIDLTAFYNQLTCPVLIIHGEYSDLLLPGTIEIMKTARPGAVTRTHTVPGAGHAPSLWDAGSLQAIKNFVHETGQSA